MANFSQALFEHTVTERKQKAVRTPRYFRAVMVTKARSSRAVQAQLDERADTSGDFAGMVRIDGNMTRTQALAAAMGISLEAAALL